ncbi:hypothetical protein [Sphingomonas melonis]
MTVREQRKAIARRMKRELGSDYVVVSSPDHPLLLRSPDVLIGGKGRLLAVMCGTAREIRQPRLARARLTLARAAMPSDTAFAFVVVRSSEHLAQELSADIDAVVSMRKLDELPRVDRSAASIRLSPEREKARAVAMKRFGHSYRIAQLINPKIEESRPRQKDKRGIHRSRVYNDYEAGVAKAELLYNPTPSDLADLALTGADRAFSLDTGVSYPVGHSGMAYVEDVPASRGDPNRFIRASAFAGWILAASSLEQQHPRLAEMILHYEAQP